MTEPKNKQRLTAKGIVKRMQSLHDRHKKLQDTTGVSVEQFKAQVNVLSGLLKEMQGKYDAAKHDYDAALEVFRWRSAHAEAIRNLLNEFNNKAR